MGQDQSAPMVNEDTPPQTLDSRTIDAVAKYIQEGRAKRIVVMTGAGISTSAGIPDFRSPDTGLYANLARLDLPYAEAVFDIKYFRENPVPFYALAQELYPGRYRPTITHSFIRLLHTKGLLLKLFTQNIDCLEREAGLPGEMIVEAHGSFARQSCIDCKASFPDDLMRKAIHERSVPRCLECDGLVKPDIVFFGEQLPSAFFENKDLPSLADLCIIMGTSLSVHPFAALPQFCSDGTPRVLINQEQVGGLGCRSDDVLVLGDCDAGVRKLAKALGWLEELEALWAETAPESVRVMQEEPKKTRDEQLQEEVDQITREVEENLRISQAQTEWLKKHVEKKAERIQEEDLKLEPTAAQSTVDGAVEESPVAVGLAVDKPAAAMPAPEVTMANKPLQEAAPSRPVKPSPDGGGLSHVFLWMKKSSL
ncbi:NAD-dependent deacetylase sirtuin-2 [Westerdykella ornata]|uniref:NAD-dependent protein deacetylase n=1 Tax=Westerdykella ornata TaxID=318751 RepID=A0A6A6J7I1_WESOR|nr:NAD-dependent deacetylase sirtuin-2 [Westerdykella ornata]KAF2272157.1 NAD-dependent deacetylase sirtuin-2 [Westerdykella ornata]